MLLSFVFVSFSMLGFSQGREVLETPARLNHCKVELPAISLPEIVNPNKRMFEVDGNPIRWYFAKPICPPIQTKVILSGLPSMYGGDFFVFNASRIWLVQN